jgi:hypothetical protein
MICRSAELRPQSRKKTPLVLMKDASSTSGRDQRYATGGVMLRLQYLDALADADTGVFSDDAVNSQTPVFNATDLCHLQTGNGLACPHQNDYIIVTKAQRGHVVQGQASNAAPRIALKRFAHAQHVFRSLIAAHFHFSFDAYCFTAWSISRWVTLLITFLSLSMDLFQGCCHPPRQRHYAADFCSCDCPGVAINHAALVAYNMTKTHAQWQRLPLSRQE